MVKEKPLQHMLGNAKWCRCPPRMCVSSLGAVRIQILSRHETMTHQVYNSNHDKSEVATRCCKDCIIYS